LPWHPHLPAINIDRTCRLHCAALWCSPAEVISTPQSVCLGKACLNTMYDKSSLFFGLKCDVIRQDWVNGPVTQCAGTLFAATSRW